MKSGRKIEKAAETARLSLTKSELNKISKELDTILKAFEELDRAVTGKDVRPSFQPVDVRDVSRKDEVRPGLTQKQALSNTKHKESGYFRGPTAV